MKLIVEACGEYTYAYIESEKHHKKVHSPESFQNPILLDDECSLGGRYLKLAFDIDPKMARKIRSLRSARKKRSKC